MNRRIVLSIAIGLVALASAAYGKTYGAWETPARP